VRILTAVTLIAAIVGAMPMGQPAAGAREQIVSAHPPDVIVDASGSGTFRTVQAAIDAVPQSTSADRRWVILVKPGVYRERIYVQREKRFVSLVGQDPRRVPSYVSVSPTRVLDAALPSAPGLEHVAR
jgi:pectin methylesterase-like acyl-CoA thioesterase